MGEGGLIVHSKEGPFLLIKESWVGRDPERFIQGIRVRNFVKDLQFLELKSGRPNGGTPSEDRTLDRRNPLHNV